MRPVGRVPDIETRCLPRTGPFSSSISNSPSTTLPPAVGPEVPSAGMKATTPRGIGSPLYVTVPDTDAFSGPSFPHPPQTARDSAAIIKPYRAIVFPRRIKQLSFETELTLKHQVSLHSWSPPKPESQSPAHTVMLYGQTCECPPTRVSAAPALNTRPRVDTRGLGAEHCCAGSNDQRLSCHPT